jgi:hypothetical protein
VSNHMFHDDSTQLLDLYHNLKLIEICLSCLFHSNQKYISFCWGWVVRAWENERTLSRPGLNAKKPCLFISNDHINKLECLSMASYFILATERPRSNVIKLFTAVNYEFSKLARFVPGKPFQPSLPYVGKAKSLP